MMSYGWAKDSEFAWKADRPTECHQCRREIVRVDGGWVHRADTSPQCPLGAAEAVRRVSWLITGRYEWVGP